MSEQPSFAAEELELLIELVERELRELPPEVRRARTSAFKEDLQRREETLRRLLERLRSVAAA